MSYIGAMARRIGQRELRNENAEIMRRVEQGESFTVTRNGKPIADLVPHRAANEHRPRQTLAEVQAAFRRLPPMDVEKWRRERAADDEIFGADDPLEDPWERA
ncbi:MAG TPA: type II toxin-antitoxin system prevent-host-death family antitoxin [Amycolatopsis sp.]|uniref:type II toxin-antitoxin system Phd/YefM family antitoxin n=1 Tax=Amycolatopsis sp. TaxID=37632 RepID=UPI002B496006|nr:type II toxin-antitoxin system prevent-host-death family antitoxin [Amycolatopsis sp.]HKS48139.1 type II toxin-antitoxin system prevent-host-death family antitoxin [Amycolatopsis sp.]